MSEEDTQSGRKPKRRDWTPLDEEVVDVIIQTESLKTRCGPCLQEGPCDSYFRRKNLNSYYWNTAFIGTTFLMMFVAFLIWLVIPFLKTLKFEAATCRTTSIKHISNNLCHCRGDDSCISEYACLVVKVKYHNKDYSHRGYGMLHDVEFGGECSFEPPCAYNSATNRDAVWSWRASIEYGTFSCFFDPEGDYIMKGPRLGIHSTVHLLLWPAAFFILCMVLLGMMCCTCGCRYPCMSKPSRDIIATADRLKEMGNNALGNLNPEVRETLVLDSLPNTAVFL